MQKSIFRCQHDFKSGFRIIQEVSGMLVYRCMQVILNQVQNQKRSPHFSGLAVNGKIYIVRTSKFQRECFAPILTALWKQLMRKSGTRSERNLFVQVDHV